MPSERSHAMSEQSNLIAKLSPEQLQLLHRRLAETAEPAALRPQIKPRGRETATFPLTFGQQQYLFLNRLEPESAAYNVPTAVRLKGALDVAALERSLNEVIKRHEALRTNFDIVEGQPVQVISPSRSLTLDVFDLSGFPAGEREREMRLRSEAEAQRTFDLASEPLLRSLLLRLADDECVLLLNTHHIICDKWSHGIFMQELATLYAAFSSGLPSPLPGLAIQCADFACWQREWLNEKTLGELLPYWKERLAGAPTSLNLPTDYPRLADHSFKAVRHPLLIDKDLTRGLKDLGRREDATLFMILLAAYKTLLYRFTEQGDVVVGFLSANRNRPEIEGLIGQFANTLVMRTALDGGQTFGELLGQIREGTLGAYAHQDLPFEKLVEELHLEREVGRTPLFQSAFNLQKAPVVSMELPGLVFSPFEIYRGPANLDLYVEMEERDQELPGALEYNAELFAAETVELLVAFFYEILQQCALHPETRLRDFKLPAELAERVNTARSREQEQTIAVTATFTAEPLADALHFWMQQSDTPARIEFSQYNQIFQQLLDPTSLLATNRHGVNVILIRIEDWQRYAAAESSHKPADLDAKIERNIRDLVSALKCAAGRAAPPHLVFVCPSSPSVMADRAMGELFGRMEELLAAELEDVSGVYLTTSAQLAETYPVAQYHDAYGDRIGHIPYTAAFFAALGTMVARKTHALQNLPYKVVVLDCDQTLWKGVCAEDGACGVEIDAPRRRLQEFMLAQFRAGMLICLCSKNNEEDVFEVFARHPEMVLQREHLVAWRINWQSKSENLRSLAAELRLGLDSFIFVDDDAVVCAEVQANCPEVLVLHHPPEDNESVGFLERIWAFDHLKITDEDLRRTSFYQQNSRRERARSESLTFESFLAGLELNIQINEMLPRDVARISQLTQRTNQFNTTTIRYSESEVQRLLHMAEGRSLVVEVRDRFGDYGTAGVIIYRAGASALMVETMLLSCRALNRGVEHRMLCALGEAAQRSGIERVDVRFIPTKQNLPAQNFLESVGVQFKEPSGEGYVYRIPAKVAATVVYSPVAKVKEAAGAAGESRAARAPWSAATRGAGLRRIATQLHDSEQILQSIELLKLRSRIETEQEYVAPKTPTEEMLAEIWSQVLGVDKVGVNDNFFKLGGHSLLAAILMSRIVDTFHAELPLRSFFQRPTIAEMSYAIDLYQIEHGNSEELAGIMQELELLSDEEVKALLETEARLARDFQ